MSGLSATFAGPGVAAGLCLWLCKLSWSSDMDAEHGTRRKSFHPKSDRLPCAPQNGIPQQDWPAEWRRELGVFHDTGRMSDKYL